MRPDCRCGDPFLAHEHLSGSRICDLCGCRTYMMPLREVLGRAWRRLTGQGTRERLRRKLASEYKLPKGK